MYKATRPAGRFSRLINEGVENENLQTPYRKITCGNAILADKERA